MPRANTADPEQVKALSKRGLNNAEIGRELKISREWVRRILGEESRRRPIADRLAADEARLRALVDRLKAGSSLRGLAAELELSEETLKRAMIAVVGQEAFDAALAASGKAATAALVEARSKYWAEASPVGLLTILGVTAVPKPGGGSEFRATVRCACGREKETLLKHIRSGGTLCCGNGGCRVQMRGNAAMKAKAAELAKNEPKGRVYA